MKSPASLRWAFAGLALVLFGFARPAAAQDGASHIAVANIAKIINSCEEWKDLKKGEEGQLKQLEEQKNGKTKELQDLKAQRDKFSKKGTPDYDKLTSDFLQKASELRAWADSQQARLTLRNKEAMKSQYDKVRGAIAQIAEKRKFDLVLNDAGGDLPEDTDDVDPERLRQFILQKNVLFTNKGVDINEDVIALLNANYKASGGAAGK